MRLRAKNGIVLHIDLGATRRDPSDVFTWNQAQDNVLIGVNDHGSIKMWQGGGFPYNGVDVYESSPAGRQAQVVVDRLFVGLQNREFKAF